MTNLLDLAKYMCPLYGVDRRGQPALVGSAIALEVAGERFLLSAAHVLDENQVSTFYVFQAGELSPLIAPDACNTVLPASGSRDDDKLDVACIRLESPFRERLDRVAFLIPTQLEVSRLPSTSRDRYTFMGYPYTKNRPGPGSRSLRLEAWSYTSPSAPTEEYQRLGVSPATHVVVPFEKEKVVDEAGRIITAPDFQGMSGGPVWRFRTDGTPKVVAVGTDHKRSPKVLVGVGMGLFAAALGERWPNLRDTLPRVTGARINVRSQPG